MRPPLPLFLILATSLLTSCSAPRSAKLYEAQGNIVHRDLVYATADGKKLLLDVYLPPEAKGTLVAKPRTYPVILWIYGGGWRWGSKDNVPVVTLTTAGFALVSFNYRLDGHAKYPAQIDDCRAALRWIRQNGSKYHLDPDRVGVLGASAGGHLAAMLGTTGGDAPDFPKAKAVCALYPPTDLITVVKEDQRDDWLGLVPLLLGGPVNQKADLARQGSPIRYVSQGDAPFFLIHGEQDTLVPKEQSQSMHRALLKAGVPSKLKLFPEEKHGFYPDKALTQEIVDYFWTYLGR